MTGTDIDTLLTPPDQQDDFTRALQAREEPMGIKRLSDGSYAIFWRLMYTYAIALGADEVGYSRRYCFQDLVTALGQWEHLKTKDDQLEDWIARRPEHQ